MGWLLGFLGSGIGKPDNEIGLGEEEVTVCTF
jgi:hypothetical protein